MSTEKHPDAEQKYIGLQKSIQLFKAFTLIFPALFLLYAYKISDNFVYLNDIYGTFGEKNGLFIGTVTVTIFVLTGFVFLILQTLYLALIRGYDFDPKPNIVLIGMMGSGKTSVGSALAKKLDLPFADIDALIQKHEGRTPSQIFAQNGEEFFRALEHTETVAASAKTPQVISTGGGCILNPDSMAALKQNGIVIFLNRPAEAIAKDVDFTTRPLINSPDDIFRIHKERLPLYEKYADFTVDGDLSPDDAVYEIMKKIDG